MIDDNNEYIRYAIPKRESLDIYTRSEAIRLMNHINSGVRDSLNSCISFMLSQMLLSNIFHKFLELWKTPADLGFSNQEVTSSFNVSYTCYLFCCIIRSVIFFI
ncbi:hypothetical protein Closa_1126 [[Clostridium] saccharolyticum WM1]|uniref:Uncharacterized protein n=1 Tax=Lacrimispora saccharolytica (strain ATCC 35040 / DSM 2544 / NRCC 2533 / WM1) TaxID=610130 RepID=D9R7L1_LACSW|nr:hypothetical protein Closa_1126 [[Clostridium] saccharolyticum WM1]